MALNPQYDAIGKGFVQQYYTLFDDPAQRANLVNMYNVSIITVPLFLLYYGYLPFSHILKIVFYDLNFVKRLTSGFTDCETRLLI